MDIELITVPYNSAGRPGGVAAGPHALRQAGLVAAVARDSRVTDAGDVPLSRPEPGRGRSGLLAEAALEAMVQAVCARTTTAIRARRLPLLLGGDCPVLLGGLAAARDIFGEVGLLFVDGHEDAWPPHAATSGEAADTELGLALGRHTGQLPAALRARLPLVHPSAVIALGPRDQQELTSSGVESLAGQITLIRPAELHAIQAGGTLASWTAAQAASLADTTGAWWLHVDLDVLATDQLAAVDYPQPGGLTWAELDTITSAAIASRGCAGWTVCIYNPELDPDRAAARRIVGHIAQTAAAAR